MKATSENVSKLYGIFGKDNFLPNMVQMIQIEQPQNIVTTVMRPQFVNENMKCYITFLPERIDVEIKEGKSISLDTIIEYYAEIIKAFELKINRIALNASAVISVSTPEESKALRKDILNEKAYPYEEKIIEWGSRNVSRKKCDDLDEIANVGQNIQSIGLSLSDEIFINQIKIDTDINTLAEKKVKDLMP